MAPSFSRTCVHERGLQRQIGVGPLVSSQERRALVVPAINRSSTRCVPPTVCIGFRLFLLPESRPGQLFSMRWAAKGSVVSWTNRSVCVPSCPAPPQRSAVRRRASNRSWYVRVLEPRNVPGHALHEKGLQRQKGIGPLVSSQEERALPLPLMNR